MTATGEKGILLGYLNDLSTYKILSFSGSSMSTREVRFNENEFPGLNKNALSSDEDPFKIEITEKSLIQNEKNLEEDIENNQNAENEILSPN